MSEQHPRPYLTSAAYYLAFIAYGLSQAVLGPTLPDLAQTTGVTLATIGLLFTARSIGNLVGSYLAGYAFDRLPGHLLWVAALLLMGVLLALFPTLPLFAILMAAMLLFGFAQAFGNVGGNTMIVWLHGRRAPPFMNALHLSYGIGSFLAPLLVALALSLGKDTTWAYFPLAASMLIPMSMMLMLPSPTLPARPANAPGRPGFKPSSLSLPVLLGALIIFAYTSGVTAYGGWVYAFAIDLGLATELQAASLVSVFFGAFSLSRLVGIPIAAKVPSRIILLADLVGALLSALLLLVGMRTPILLWVGTFTLGFSLATIFPATMTLIARLGTVTGAATAWLIIGGNIAEMTVPWLAGLLMTAVAPWTLPALVALILLAGLGIAWKLNHMQATGQVQ